jgi:hypothetical protein
MTEGRCHCGQPLHYTDAGIASTVQAFVDDLGEYLIVTGSDGRHWKVQRHYIALHGLREQDLPTLGFEEVRDADGPG